MKSALLGLKYRDLNKPTTKDKVTAQDQVNYKEGRGGRQGGGTEKGKKGKEMNGGRAILFDPLVFPG